MDKLLKKIKESDPGQRKAAGNIFKFIGLLLAFTLIARGTSGATLAKVELESPVRATIMEAITGTAVVSIKELFEVYAPAEGLTILEMYAETGQNLNTGEAIARFDMDILQEKMVRETANLEQLIFNRQKLGSADSVDVSSLETARRGLSRAREDYEATYSQGIEDIENALADYEEALAEITDEQPDAYSLQSAIRSYQRALEDFQSTLRQNQNEITAAEEALAEAFSAEPDFDNTSLQTALRTLQRRQEDYDAAVRQNNENISAALKTVEDRLYEYHQAMSAYAANPTDNGYNAVLEAERRVTAAQEAHQSLIESTANTLTNPRRNLEDAQNGVTQARENYERGVQQTEESMVLDIERATNALESAKNRANDNELTARRRLEDAETSLTQAERNYERDITNEIERTRNVLSTAQNRADDNLNTARRRVEDAEASLSSAQQSYERNVRSSQETLTQNRISLITLQLDIENQETAIETLENAIAILSETDGILYSEYDCVVYSTLSENTVTGKQPLISFKDSTQGHEALITINASDAENLAVGFESQVSTGGGNMYYIPTVTGIISSVSQPDENDRVTVTIQLPEYDWNENQRVDVEIILSSASYDFSVPISALRSDNTGYFVYTVETQSTVLGIQNIATRTNVILNASDANYASISGGINRNSLIITGSNKTVSAGDRVRVSGE